MSVGFCVCSPRFYRGVDDHVGRHRPVCDYPPVEPGAASALGGLARRPLHSRGLLTAMELSDGGDRRGTVALAATTAQHASPEQRRRPLETGRGSATEVTGRGVHALTIARRTLCARVAILAGLTAGLLAGCHWRVASEKRVQVFHYPQPPSSPCLQATWKPRGMQYAPTLHTGRMPVAPAHVDGWIH